MAGSIKQRGTDSWLLTAYAGWDAGSRRRRYVTKTVRGSRRQAERALADLVAEANRLRAVAVASDGKALSVHQVLTRWLKSREGVFAASTVDRYRVAIKHLESSPVGSLPVAKLRPHHIEDLYATLLAEGQSGSSIRKLHWAMRQALAWGHRRGLVYLVATSGVELPPLGERRLMPPESSDVRRLVSHLLEADPEWGTAVAFVAWTGCRRGEACGLQWPDLDLVGGTALIARSVASVPGGHQVKGTKTGEMRRIALGPRTVELLRVHRDRCDSHAALCGAELVPAAFVFSPVVDGSSPYNPHTFTRVFVDACRAAGVPRMRLHDLRHHSATALLKSGSSVGEVMDRHGWKTVEMVNRYRHLLEARDASAAEALENA